jgi:hypothetical protein
VGRGFVLFKVLTSLQQFSGAGFAPQQEVWLKFLSGCYARKIKKAIFMATGQLRADQRREAREANVTIIEGRKEIARVARLCKSTLM